MARSPSITAHVLALSCLSCSRTALPFSVSEDTTEHMPATAEPEAGEPHGDVLPPHPDGELVRFVVLGDGGTGDAHQYRVARAVQTVCAREGCDFALYLGDNIYEVGVSGIDDTQFRTKFEEPFAALDFPFYVVLGNHDYGSGVPSVESFDVTRVDAQIEYTAHSDKWNMPSRYYTFRVGPVAFFALDTGAFVYDFQGAAAAQQAWLEQELAASDAPWKIAFGHHPYVSNGYHGNAGNYEGSAGTPAALYPTGEALAALFEHSVCGKAQVYFAGHDHHREWLQPACGTQFIISGAAAKLRALAARDRQPTRYRDDWERGFLWVELDRDRFTGVFYDDFGQADFRSTFLRLGR